MGLDKDFAYRSAMTLTFQQRNYIKGHYTSCILMMEYELD